MGLAVRAVADPELLQLFEALAASKHHARIASADFAQFIGLVGSPEAPDRAITAGSRVRDQLAAVATLESPEARALAAEVRLEIRWT